jgi:hypothetical protein
MYPTIAIKYNIETTTTEQICILYTTKKHMQKDEFEFGLTIPQEWRGGDLPLEEENNPVKQYEFSKSISFTADIVIPIVIHH